jgi:hypothetical protein
MYFFYTLSFSACASLDIFLRLRTEGIASNSAITSWFATQASELT